MKTRKILLGLDYRIKKFIFSSMLLLLGCQSGLVNQEDNLKAKEGYGAEPTDKLFIVDCLLPGQIRKLGSRMTYLTARRPIKTTAADCEVRGGEYVAYDRANYASALRVWLPPARQGNVDAQVMVGEIYEKGMGGLADPALAAKWYKKAAEQGNSRAQIDLGHLYEKGLGVNKSLPTALNWYRKASGLDNSDLEFASVTKATVTARYEKQLKALRKSSRADRQQADKLRKQLNQTRWRYSTQQKRLAIVEKQLNQIRLQLNDEKHKKHHNRQLIQKLEKDLRTRQNVYEQQKNKLSKIQLDIVKDSQDSASSYQLQLENQQQLLRIKEAKYHDTFIAIKSELSRIEEKSAAAVSTQDKLAVMHLRDKLKVQKSELLKIGKQIKQLKGRIVENQKIIAKLETQDLENLSFAQADIEMIEPRLVVTRGIPSYQLRSISHGKKIIGKVSALKDLQSLTVNGQTINVDQQGVFRTTVEIKHHLNPVAIIATYKKGHPKLLQFNLLAKGSTSVADNYPMPVKVVAKNYPSINFGRFYALVIGNQNYKQLPALQTSINDAKAVEKVLRSRYGYKTLLLINADRHQIMTALDRLRKILTKKDNLLIYYAGHGEIDKSDQSAYWLPTDAELNNSANWLSSHSITQFLNIIAARHILVVADSCYSGAMTQSSITRLPNQMPEEKRKKWLKFMVKRKSRTVMTSGGVQPVLDSGGGRHSVFAKAFLSVLQRDNGVMEDYELFRVVSGNVEKSAALVGFQQTPQYAAMLHAGHEGSPFFFVPTVH